MALPAFIDPAGFPDGQQVPWPYTFKMRSQWYLLPAQEHILQEVCDLWLNLDPRNLRYENILRHVLLAVNHYTYIHPDDPPYSARGFVTANEIALCVMAAKFEKGSPLPSGVTLFTPLIFVDNPMVSLTGLAVFGFPKQVGEIAIQGNVENPSLTSLSAWVFPAFGPDSRLEMGKVLSVKVNGAGDADQEFASYSSEARYLFDSHKKPDLDPKVAGRIEHLFSGVDSVLTLTTLKQFRDAEEPTRACYQAIVESKMKDLKGFKGGLLKSKYAVSLFPSGSLPIAKSLGLGNLSQIAGFWFDLELKFGYAKNLVVSAG